MRSDRQLLRLLCSTALPRQAWYNLRAGGGAAGGPGRILAGLRVLLDGERLARHRGAFVISSFLPPLPSAAFATGMRAAGTWDDRRAGRRRAPLSAYLAVTRRCPLACGHCSARQTGGAELDTAGWRRVIAGLQDAGVAIIGLTGGEPLARSDLTELVASIDQRSTSLVFSSGAGFTAERAAALVRAGLFGLCISLDGPDAASHDARRGCPGSFAQAIAAIGFARRAGLYTLAQTLVRRADLADHNRFLAIARLAKRSGAQELRVIEPMPAGALAAAGNEAFYDVADRDRLIAWHHEANRRADCPKVSTFAWTEDPSRFGCGAGTQHCYVAADGALQPCDFVPLAVADLRHEDVGAALTRLREAVGNPRRTCMAQALRQHGTNPLRGPAACARCTAMREEGLPGAYRRLGG